MFATGYVSERTAIKAKAQCNHRYPISAESEEEGYRARCLGCGAVGPLRKDARDAHKALLSMSS